MKKLIITITIVIFSFQLNVFAQGLNFAGNPTGTAGTGNARTDADNLFIRNNVAGITEIPLNDEEERTGNLTSAAKGHWRFFSEGRAFIYQHRSQTNDFATGIPTRFESEQTTITPNIAAEATYTSNDHRYGFGIGTYQIVHYRSRFIEPARFLGDQKQLFDTHISSTDIAVGGAYRLHKKLSVGGAFIFGRAFIDLKGKNFVNFNLQERIEADDFGAPGVQLGFHYRPTNYLSFAANYKSKRSYQLKGKIKNAFGSDRGHFQTGVFNSDISLDFDLPTIAEAGLQFNPTKNLLLAFDFRFYDYSATLQGVDEFEPSKLKTPNNLEIFFPLFPFSFVSGLDVHSFHMGGKYRINDNTSINFGATITSNGIASSQLSERIIDNGNTIAFGINKRIKDSWLLLGLGYTFRRDRPEIDSPSFFSKQFSGRGLLVSIGLRR
ncbi:MAG: outer membrane protein transport protein [Acidobacteriota bacterium]